MRKVITLLVVFAMVLGMFTVCEAQRSGGQQADVTKDSVIDKAGDWIATRGKTPEEAKAIRADRKAERTLKRAQKEAEKAKKAMEKEMKKSQKQMKKGFGKK
ncbi:MAG: hypothetical protein WBD00_04625 [Candidatus Omnitrophota bacterium]